MLFLDRNEVAANLDGMRLLDVLADGFKAMTSRDGIAAPDRSELVIGDKGRLLTMQAHAASRPVGTKLVSIFPGNAQAGLPSHLALIILVDADTGAPLAVMDGTHITAMRTAGAAVLAAKLLARPDARVMTILGAGVQGHAHLELMTQHFHFETIYIGSRDRASAERLAARDPRAVVTDDDEAAVRRSDIVCLCSDAAEPLIIDAWIKPGQHISSVGYAPPGGELDPAIAASRRLFVETRTAFSAPPAGCAELAGIDPVKGTELGELLLGRRPGRETPRDVTVYKAMGHAIEDLVVADMVYRSAVERGAGHRLTL